MQPHRTAARVAKGGTVIVTGVPAPEGEEVEVIVITKPPTATDAGRYLATPVAPSEFSDDEDPLGWDGEGWDDIP